MNNLKKNKNKYMSESYSHVNYGEVTLQLFNDDFNY